MTATVQKNKTLDIYRKIMTDSLRYHIAAFRVMPGIRNVRRMIGKWSPDCLGTPICFGGYLAIQWQRSIELDSTGNEVSEHPLQNWSPVAFPVGNADALKIHFGVFLSAAAYRDQVLKGISSIDLRSLWSRSAS